MQQFSRFSLVGALGFVADSLAFGLFLALSDHALVSRLLAFWTAMTVTWLGNRQFTFTGSSRQPALQQWLKHSAGAHLAGVFNIGGFYLLDGPLPTALAFATGVGIGLVFNYLVASRWVFRREVAKPRIVGNTLK